MKNPTTDYMKEIAKRLAKFERDLPRPFNARALSRSKVPFMAREYRETLTYRITELGQAALENFSCKRFVAAILLTRAAVETAAALLYLRDKLASAIDTDDLGDLDKYLRQLTIGSRTWGDFPNAINVMTFVDHAEKEFAGFKRQYEQLCEYSHPNYLGTTGLYSALNNKTYEITFNTSGSGRGAKSAETIGVINLSVALMLFDHLYKEHERLMPAFVGLCEKHLSD